MANPAFHVSGFALESSGRLVVAFHVESDHQTFTVSFKGDETPAIEQTFKALCESLEDAALLFLTSVVETATAVEEPSEAFIARFCRICGEKEGPSDEGWTTVGINAYCPVHQIR